MSGPLYEGLAAELRELVANLPPGERLPSQPQLMEDLGATLGTLREALKLLEREGLVISRQGRGWFVRENDPVKWFASWPESGGDPAVTPSDAWSRGVREQGRTPDEGDIEAAILIAEPRIAARLRIEEGAYVGVRRRVRYVDGLINNRNDTFYPRELFEGTPIALPGDIVPGVITVLEELGRGWKTRHDEIFARHATAAEAALFGVEVGEPMIEVLRTRFDSDQRPVAVTLVVAPGSRFTCVYEGIS